MRRGVASLALLAWVGCAGASPRDPVSVSDGRYAMGTVLEITLVASDAESARAVLDELFALAQRLDALFTVYDPESELSRLNRAAGRGPQSVDRELAEVLTLSKRYAQLTRGSFDVTVGPLVELWKRAAARDRPPDADALARARQGVGSQHVVLYADGRVALARSGSSIDLGGIAKGYALDRMRRVLAEHGIRDALLDFGQSSSWALGRPLDAPAWRLLARGPGDDLLGVLNLENRALSVSGSLGQWLTIGGRRYGHVLDPRSGQPLTRRRQALVVAPEAALAEALSKALLVLGEREGLALVEAQAGCEGLLVDADGGAWRTGGWDAAVRFEPL